MLRGFTLIFLLLNLFPHCLLGINYAMSYSIQYMILQFFRTQGVHEEQELGDEESEDDAVGHQPDF